VPDTVAANQAAFEQRRVREKYCKQWLKAQQKTVAKPIRYAALAGISNGVLLMLQSALLAFILHSLLINKENLWENRAALNFDFSHAFLGLWEKLPVNHAATNLLLPSCALLLLVMGLRSGCAYGFQSLGFEAAAMIKTQLRQTLFARLPQLAPDYVKQQPSGELAATTLEHIEALELYFSRYCPQQTIIAVLPVLMIAVVWTINWVVGLIFLVAFPLVIVFMALIGLSAAAASRGQFLAMARMGGYFLDRLQGLPTLKLFGQAQRELDTITQVADDFRGTTMKVLRIAFLSSTALEFFSAIGIALVAVYVGLGLMGLIEFGAAKTLTLQQALFLLLLAPEFFMPLRQLGVFYHDRAAALGAADLLLQVMDAPIFSWSATPRKPQTAIPLEVQLHQVCKNYGERAILKNINVAIKNGEKIALVGESGAGKTTLLKLLLGLEKTDSGEIHLNGQSLHPALAHENIAWVGQHASIFYGTIAENISLFNELAYSDEEIEAAATAAGVMAFSQHLENGLATVIGERGYGLSGGQIQRIALARAFLKNAPLILLDEPTAHLDEATKIQVLDVIETLFKEKTLLIASHDALVIERMERQIVLENGEIQ
jgi:ATP-binding cassette subfamily C protein CydD